MKCPESYQTVKFSFLFMKGYLNHRDISCIFFFNCRSIYFLMNIYSDSSQMALKYLKNTKANINNALIMTSDFNIRDNIWDPLLLWQPLNTISNDLTNE